MHWPEHPWAKADGYLFLAEVAAHQLLGRPLARGETIRFRDGNRWNPTPENVQVVYAEANLGRFLHPKAVPRASRPIR